MERDLNSKLLNINKYTIKNSISSFLSLLPVWQKHGNTYIMSESKGQWLHFPPQLLGLWAQFYFLSKEKGIKRQNEKTKGKQQWLLEELWSDMFFSVSAFIYLVGDFCLDPRTFIIYHYFPPCLITSVRNSSKKIENKLVKMIKNNKQT